MTSSTAAQSTSASSQSILSSTSPVSDLPASSASLSASTGLSRLACVRLTLFSGVAVYLFPFVGYRFLVQARLVDAAYHCLLATAATFVLMWSWQSMSIVLRLFAVWLILRGLLMLGSHMACRSLHKYYQQPPRGLRLARQTTRAVTFVVVIAALAQSSGYVLSESPDDAVLATWCLLMVELTLTLCAAWLYGLLHLVFRHRELSTLFPFVQPASFSFDPLSSATSTAASGLSNAELSRLPCSEYRVDVMPALAEDGCVICQCGVVEGEAVRLLRCGHGFHRQCVDQWLQRRSVCPLCVQVVTADNPPLTNRQQQVELVVQTPVEV